MDRRSIVAVVLAVAVYWAWLSWVGTTNAPPAQAEVDPTAEPAPADAPAPPVAVAASPEDAPPSAVSAVPERSGTLRACEADLGWTSRGGGLVSVVLDQHEAPYQMQPLWQWLLGKVTGEVSGPWRPYGGEPGPVALATERAELLAVGSGALDRRAPDVEILRAGADEVVTRGRTTDGVEVTRRVSAQPADPCTLAVEVTWRNTGSAPYADGLWLALHDELPVEAGRYSNVVRPHAMADGDYETWANLKKLTEPEPMTGKVDWIALSDQYFAFVLIPTGQDAGSAVFSPVPRETATLHGVHYRVGRTLEPGEAHTESFSLYVGPKDHDVLKGLAPGLQKLVALGWFAFFGRILLWLLHLFYGLVGNWGLSIILLTLLVKGLFFPLTQASFRSSQAMQAIQPALAEVRERFKDNPEELNRQTLALFRDNGVNPLSGCLPMLVQMPVWIALYSVLLASVDLYHVEFLYLRDLSSVDPYMVLPTLVVILMMVQQQFMPTANMDPMQARMMKWMPVIFGVFFFTFPSGLVVYIFVNMVLTILQQWWIKRSWRTVSAAQGSVTT